MFQSLLPKVMFLQPGFNSFPHTAPCCNPPQPVFTSVPSQGLFSAPRPGSSCQGLHFFPLPLPGSVLTAAPAGSQRSPSQLFSPFLPADSPSPPTAGQLRLSLTPTLILTVAVTTAAAGARPSSSSLGSGAPCGQRRQAGMGWGQSPLLPGGGQPQTGGSRPEPVPRRISNKSAVWASTATCRLLVGSGGLRSAWAL